MRNEATLASRIMSVNSPLSRSHKKLACFVSDNGLFVAFASAAALGNQVGVSAATVVRFCRTIGYEGYAELQAAVRANLPTYIHKVEKLERESEALDKDQAVKLVFDLDMKNLSRTIASLDAEKFKAATAALAQASDILVVGGGLSAAPALYFAHSLKVMGIDARAVLNGGIPLALELIRLKTTSVIIGFSVWRYVCDTITAMEQAKSLGATRLAITDSTVAPLAQRADYAFQVATDGVAHSLSLTSMMTLINAFIAALSFVRPEETARAVHEVDAAYRQWNLLFTE
ncbi:MAG: MurR/RpiR family transcriptional regulator [Chloroflexota bacterium]